MILMVMIFYVDTPEGIKYFRKEQIKSTAINYFDFLMNDKNVAPFYKYVNGDELFKFDREEVISRRHRNQFCDG